MPELEVVYAIRNFTAENADEISINVGEQVIVLEKDDGYNDGWWQGCNIRGEIGLFPVTYTSRQISTATPSSPPFTTSATLENKIDSLESTITKMKENSLRNQKNSISSFTSITSKNMQAAVNQSLDSPNLNSQPVEEWTSEQVAAWLQSLGFEAEIADNFKDQEITGDILLELTLDSLKELQITTFGKRFKIHNAINALRQETKKQQIMQNYNNAKFDSRTSSVYSDSNKRNSNGLLSSVYNSFKQPQFYMEDDVVSDYNMVLRNSQLASPNTSLQQQHISGISISRPPSEMERSNHRLSSLVDHNAINATPLERHRLTQQQQQQQQQQQYKLQLLEKTVSQTNSLNDASSDYSRSTVLSNQDTENRLSSIPSRYSFMRNNKLHSILPSSNSSSSRRSEDFSGGISESSLTAPDMEGWLYKQGDKYKTWNKRWFVLKGSNLFYFKSPKAIRVKGIINLKGYRINVDESIQPGKYCFMAHHDRERTFYFYTDYEKSMKDWLKALMKATIIRDFATPVMSSNTIPTISLEMARKMRPRPPSTIFSTQKELSPSFRSINQHFSVMSLDERPEPFINVSNPQQDGSRGPSSINMRQPLEQEHYHRKPNNIADSMSDYSIDQRNRMNDSGFNSTGGGGNKWLTRTGTGSSGSTTHHSMSIASVIHQQNTPSTNFNNDYNNSNYQPHEDDEDLIDPDQKSVAGSTRLPNGFNSGQKQEEYIEWINANVTNGIRSLSELNTGDVLLEFLGRLSGKEIPTPVTLPSQTVATQKMDRVISVFKFLNHEGIQLDGICSIRDILDGNELKILRLLTVIEKWSGTASNDDMSLSKRRVSNGTLDDAAQANKLSQLATIGVQQHAITLR